MSLTAVRPRETLRRAADELRPLGLELGGLSRSDGGASFAFGSTKAVASVSGPIEVRLNAELPSRATLEVNMRPSAGVSATSEKRYSKDLREVLEQVLVLSHHPRTLVQLVIQALSPVSAPHWATSTYSSVETAETRAATHNPSLIAACLNASSLAFLHASSIPMRGVLCAVAVGKPDVGAASLMREGLASGQKTQLVLDPEEQEYAQGWGIFAFVFGATFDGGPKMKGCEVLWADCHGLASEEEYGEALELAYKGAQKIVVYFRQELSANAGVQSRLNDMDLSS